MKVIIEEEARKYLEEKGYKDLHIKANVRGSCGCSGLISKSLQKGKPKRSLYGFNSFESDGINIYVPSFLQWKKDTIEIGLKSYLGIKSIVLLNLEDVN